MHIIYYFSFSILSLFLFFVIEYLVFDKFKENDGVFEFLKEIEFSNLKVGEFVLLLLLILTGPLGLVITLSILLIILIDVLHNKTIGEAVNIFRKSNKDTDDLL